MSRDSTLDDIEDELSSWGYLLSVSDYERSQIEESPTKTVNVVFGRGKGISDSNYVSNVKLASEISEIEEKVVPLGYLPTTKEVLNGQDINEITPLLRRLGITGQDGEMSSRKTRKLHGQEGDIRIEGNLPIILNGELFAMINEDNSRTNSYNEQAEEWDDEPYDPNRPLHEQFSTIQEFALTACEPTKEHRHSWNSSASETLSSHSTPISDESSSCSSSNTTFSASEQDSNNDMLEPLLKVKHKLYTPRQLYELKKMPPKESLPKSRFSRTD